MSTKGIYTALSGAMAQNLRIDTIANNIANVNTPAFKRDQQAFAEYLTANEKPPAVIQVPKVPASIESFYDNQGGDKSYVDTQGTFTDFSQGSLKPTGNKLDIGIDGKGFFEVATPGGVMLTRAGNFTLDGTGQIVTKEGFPVLQQGEAGAEASTRVLKVTGQKFINIADNGDVYEGENLIGKLSIVNVSQEDALKKIGHSMYGFKDNFKAEVTQAPNPSLKQGFIEVSNINIIQEMTDMISAHRVFESTQKALSTYDGMADKLVNVVGKTTP